MRLPLPAKLLLPHAIAALCFALSFAWWAHVGSNRTLPDLYLAIAGYVATTAAVVASLLLLVRVLSGAEQHARWLWLLAHLAALALLASLGSSWLGGHLA